MLTRRELLALVPAMGAAGCGYTLAGRGSFLPAYIQTIGIPAFGNVTPYATVERSARGIFFGEDRIAEYGTREGRVGMDAGMVLGTWGEARIGPLWRHINAKVETGLPAASRFCA